ncbi:MAG: phosphoribosylformylglycinamidine synthase, partial [Lentisphaerae bacterium]|nr:phosphoribosylformylglycinamidine synthase [Lentisphaerota bacterium]
MYLIDAELAPAALAAAQKAFTDPVIETSACGRLPPPRKFDWLIEIGFKPGVTDNVGRTARSALQDVLERDLPAEDGVYTAIQYFISSRTARNRTKINRLARDLLANPLIQTIAVYTPDTWRQHRPEALVPAIHDTQHISVNTYDLQGTDADLMRISREKILSCSLDEMRAIRDYFNRPGVRRARQALGLPRDPTDVEVECIAQTWSEHCSHKIFAAEIDYSDELGNKSKIKSLYRSFIKASTRKIARKRNWLVSVFTDNAGIIRFTPRRHLVYKVETHNSPSALDPYGGAMTGIVGVNRDPMGTGMGAALLCNVWGYCLGSPFHKPKMPAGLMHPRRIRDGVHQGVIEGGNQSGIPWMRGWEVFDERFTGKPLVFCGTVGTLPVKVTGRPSERKEVRAGDILVVTGGRIGKDGIHGATFSSEELREESPVQAVQIGDPITQRKMYEFLLEARDLGLFRCITDNGAGGLSCSAGEMGRLSGGVELDLARAPLKYHGLQPWEILLSEAQERMTLAVAPGKLKALRALARRRDVEATALGKFTDSGEFVIKYGKQTVGRLDMKFLYDGCPTMHLRASWRPPRLPAPAHPRQHDHGQMLRDLLSSLDVCSREYKSRQYDGEVKGLSVVKPFVGVHCDIPADATVMRVAYDEQAGIVLAEGVNPFLSDIDTYAMTASVIDEAVRRAISAGADPEHLAGLDNFCWPDPVQSDKTPDGEYKLAQLVRACRALYDVTTAYGVPCISGKDSCKNDSTRGGRKISIPPTLLFSVIAKINDVRRAVTMDAKQPGDLVYLLGLTRPELGASALHRLLAARMGRPQHIGGQPPILETTPALRLYRALHRAIDLNLVHSSHTPTRGGMAVALALKALGGDLGLEIDLQDMPTDGDPDPTARLFAECNSRFIVTAPPEHAAELESVFRGLPWARIGRTTTRRRLLVRQQGQVLLDSPL